MNHFVQSKRFITPVKPEIQVPEKEEAGIKAFVPYSSVLSFMTAPLPVAEVPNNNYEKKKSKTAKFPKSGKVLNPMSKQGVTKGKSAFKLQVQAKKQKATMARKKAQNKVVATVELPDSDESDSDCIPVELPPPPLITLDSSDEENIRKKRAMSPSTSSIISDDFIVAGDKRQIANPFKAAGMSVSKKLRKIAEQKATLEKVKALTKVPSSSSDSARSSCERAIECQVKPQEGTLARSSKHNRSNKDSTSLNNSNEDSIYGVKGAKVNKQTKELPKSSSEEETLYVNAKNVRRRKSSGSRKKSTDHSEVVEDPKQKLISSTPIVKTPRSRFITPNYDENDFATMISTIINPGEVVGDESVDETEAVIEKLDSADVITIADSTESVVTSNKSTAPETDCEIVEEPTIVYEVPDADTESDDSMRGFNRPIECDLSLNVTEIPYDPHEFIRDRAEGSQLIQASSEALVDPEIGWNDEMKFFYDGSWGDKFFCISSILETMPRDQKFWKIINADRNRTFESGCRVRCKKCNEIGHFAAKCTKPKKRVVCFMCGEEGHRETRCPNSICLRVSMHRYVSTRFS